MMANFSFAHPTSMKVYFNCSQFFYEVMNRYYNECSSLVLQAVSITYENVVVGNLLDVRVSYGGTWMIRGYKSQISVGFVIECNTGFILDFEI